MDALKLDAFVYPTWSNPPRLIGDLNTPHGDNSQFFSPTTGFPAIQVPMGYTRGGRAAGGHHVLRPRVVRGDADQAGVRLRAGHPAPPPAGVARRRSVRYYRAMFHHHNGHEAHKGKVHTRRGKRRHG